MSLEPASPTRVTAQGDARGPGAFQELVTEPGAPGQPLVSLPTHTAGSFCTPRIVGASPKRAPPRLLCSTSEAPAAPAGVWKSFFGFSGTESSLLTPPSNSSCCTASDSARNTGGACSGPRLAASRSHSVKILLFFWFFFAHSKG